MPCCKETVLDYEQEGRSKTWSTSPQFLCAFFKSRDCKSAVVLVSYLSSLFFVHFNCIRYAILFLFWIISFFHVKPFIVMCFLLSVEDHTVIYIAFHIRHYILSSFVKISDWRYQKTLKTDNAMTKHERQTSTQNTSHKVLSWARILIRPQWSYRWGKYDLYNKV